MRGADHQLRPPLIVEPPAGDGGPEQVRPVLRAGERDGQAEPQIAHKSLWTEEEAEWEPGEFLNFEAGPVIPALCENADSAGLMVD